LRLAAELLRSFTLASLRMFYRTAGLRHDVGEKFTKALSRTDLLGSSTPCLLAVLALALPAWLAAGKAYLCAKFDVRNRKTA